MKRRNKIELNIGLKNNPFNSNEIIDKLFETELICELVSFNVLTGRYKREAENTLIVEAFNYFKLSTCVDIIERLCSVLNQECIATKIDNNELLIYSETYKGEKMKFNEDYFLSINSKDKLLINDTELRAFELLEDSKDCLEWITFQPEFEALKNGSSAKEIIKEIEEFFKMI